MPPYGHMCDRFYPHFVPVLHSTMGRGPRGYGVTVEKVEDGEGVYRLQFRNTITGEIEEVTPNLYPDITIGPSVFVCDHDFDIVTAEATYTANSSWFVQDVTDAKVGDTVIFGGLVEDENQPGEYYHIVCAGVITNISLPSVTFKSYLESDTGQSAIYIIDNSVTTNKIQDQAITTPKIADDSVTGDKIADGAVDTNQIANNSITSGKIADGTIGTADIADNAVIWDKIDTSTVPVMSDTTPGIAKAGDGLVVNNGTLEIDPNILNVSGGVVIFSDTYANTYDKDVLTLDQSAANFSRLFIEFEDSATRKGSIILDDPNGSFFEMFTIGGNARAGAIFRFKSMHVDDNVIRIEISPANQLRNYGTAVIASDGTSSYADAQEIGIIRVIGFE